MDPGTTAVRFVYSKEISRNHLKDLLNSQADLRSYLNFVPVKAGDFFNIPPGVPHGIGPGVTLLEPQRILPGKSGKTYRMWDWNRRYDENGQPCAHGAPRPLHIEESLRIVDPKNQHGPTFINSLRSPKQEILSQSKVQVNQFSGNNFYNTYHTTMAIGKSIKCQLENGYGAMIILKGAVSLSSKNGFEVRAEKGQPLLLPNLGAPYNICAEDDCEFSIACPIYSVCNWS